MNADILVVDDQCGIRKLIRSLLSDDGYEATEAESAEKALDVLRSNAAIRLVITDYAMIGMTGIDLITWMKASRPEVKAILITGDISDAMERALASGAAAVFAKPLSWGGIRSKIAELMRPG